MGPIGKWGPRAEELLVPRGPSVQHRKAPSPKALRCTILAPSGDVLGVILAPSWASWGVLGDLGPNIAPRRSQERKYTKNLNIFYTLLAAKLEPRSTQNRSGGLPKSRTFFDGFWGQMLVAFGPNFGPTWPPKPSQRFEPDWFQNQQKSDIYKKSVKV